MTPSAPGVYAHSGKLGSALFLAPIGGLSAALVLGVVYAYVDVYSPIAGYVSILFVVGFAFALGWTPCIGPTLAAALTIAASGGQPALGAALLFVYALGLGLPFLLAGLFMQQATGAMGFLKRHLNVISTTGAVVLIVFGVLLATGEMAQLTTRLSGYAPAL